MTITTRQRRAAIVGLLTLAALTLPAHLTAAAPNGATFALVGIGVAIVLLWNVQAEEGER